MVKILGQAMPNFGPGIGSKLLYFYLTNYMHGESSLWFGDCENSRAYSNLWMKS